MSKRPTQAANHTVLTLRSFLSYAGTMLAVDLINVGYGVIDLAFIAPFGVVMVGAVGLGDLVTLMFLAFFGGIIDVFSVRLARAEGTGNTVAQLPRLCTGFVLVAMLWLVVGLGVAFVTPSIFELIGSEPDVAAAASSYVTVRMIGVPFTLILGAVSVSLRVIGHKRTSVWIILTGLVLNVVFNALFLYGWSATWWRSPVVAIAAATVLVQIVAAAIGVVILYRCLRARKAPEITSTKQSIGAIHTAAGMLRTSLGVGLRQMNNYAAAVVPFMLISRLDVAVIAAATVATKIWTLYCRVPQAALGSSSVFIAFARGRSRHEAYAVAAQAFRYTAIPSLFVAVIVGLTVPLLSRILGGEHIDLGLVWILATAYLVAVPFYVVENFAAEVLTVEQQAAWLSIPSTLVAYLVAIPIAAIGVLGFESATIAVLGAGGSTVILAGTFSARVRRLGYSLSFRGDLPS